jgi:outer membrane protein TolC
VICLLQSGHCYQEFNRQLVAKFSLRLVEQQYALSAASYLQLLQSQQQAQQTLIGVVELRARRLANTVTLYQAMGGGYKETLKSGQPG